MPIANTTIRIKKSVVSGNIPSTLANGEIAINSADGKLYYATPSGSIAHLTNSQSFATINANSSLILATSPTDTLSIAAGNNISITTNTTTKTITINSTDSGGLTIDAIARTTANAAFDKANSANILAQSAYSSSNTVNVYAFSAYSTANSAQSNTIALQGISTTQNTWISSNATFTQSAFNQANTANNTANIAATNITVLQSVNTVQNTTIGAAFDKANSANILAQSAFNQANTANTRAYSTVLKTGDTMTGQLTISNTNISTNTTTGALIVSGGVGIAGNTWSSGKLSLGNSLSHVNLGNVLNTAATSGVSTYRAINLIDTVAAVKIARLGNNPSIELQEWDNNITNLSSYWDIVSATNGTFQIRDRITGTSKAYLSIFQANGSVYLLSNTISTNTSTGSLILGGGLGANGNIYATAVYSNNALVLTSEPIGQGAFTFANTVNTYAYSANTFLQANDASTLNTSQTYTNTTNTAMKAYVDQANTGMASYVLSSNNAVTAYVTAANTAMKAYVDQANTGLKSYTDATHYAKTGGTISGSVSITTDLTVSGNLFVNGTTTTINTSSIVVNDPLIFLGNNNTISDTVDIGIIGHYNATQNAHTGIFRDANLKEWFFFQNYTPEIRANNLINISDPSFATSNVIASNFKGNLIGNTATVNGIELGSYSQAAFSKANTAASNTVVLQGISTTQNTWISSNAAFTQAAFTQANSANILAQSAYTFANTVNVFTQSAYSKANTSLANNGTVITVNGSSQLVIANTLPSTSNITGALVVSGGVGIGGNVNVTGTVTTSSPVVISANSTTDALRITQVGAGNALLVEDSANPDATPFVVNASGQVGIGLGGSSIPGGASLYVASDGTANYEMDLLRAGDNTGGQTLEFRKTRGTVAAPTIVASGDTISNISFRGYDGAGNIQAASIVASVDGTPGTNDMPGRLVFATTADGASSVTERMRIDNAGRVGIGGAATTGEMVAIRNTAETTATVFGLRNVSNINQATTTTVYGISDQTQVLSPAALTNLFRFRAAAGSFTGTATNQYGYAADSTLTGATNNYGFHSNIASGTGRWNFYAAGTADNYFEGKVGIGTTTPNVNLEVVATNPSLVARSNNTAGFTLVGALASDYYSTPTYRGTYLGQYGSTASGTTLGFANANLGYLAFQNIATNALIYTNGGTAIVFGTTSIDRGRVDASGVWSLGAAPGAESLRVTPVASAVNYVQIYGAVTTGAVTVEAAGSDANIWMNHTAKGTGIHQFISNSTVQFRVGSTASSVNYLQVQGAITGSPPITSAQGSDTNVSLQYLSKGTGNHNFGTAGGTAQFLITHTASAVNYLQVTGSAAGFRTAFSVQGSDTNVGINYNAKGAEYHVFTTSGGVAQFVIQPTASAVNHMYLTGGTTGNAPVFSAQGSDTNIGITLTPKGTGGVAIGATSASGYKLYVNGSFAAITKSFVIDHPTKPNMKLRYGSLEGPENGVYIRGKLEGDTIQLPEYWTKLVDPDSITVNLTPIGSHQKLYVKDIVDNKVMIGNENLIGKGIKCFYIIFAERNDVEKLQVEIG